MSCSNAEHIGRVEPPPRYSVQRDAEIRDGFMRSTVHLGGGRSPQWRALNSGGKSGYAALASVLLRKSRIPATEGLLEIAEDLTYPRCVGGKPGDSLR